MYGKLFGKNTPTGGLDDDGCETQATKMLFEHVSILYNRQRVTRFWSRARKRNTTSSCLPYQFSTGNNFGRRQVDPRQCDGLCGMDCERDQFQFGRSGLAREIRRRARERYEDERTEAITNTSSRESCQYIATISSEDLHPVPSENASHPPPAIHSSFYKEAEKAAREQARRNMRHQALLTSSSSDESSLLDHPSQGPPTSVSDIEVYNTGNEQDEEVFADQHSASGEETVHDEQEVVTDQHSPCEEAVHHEDEDKAEHVNESDARDSDGFYFLSPTPWQINADMYFRRVAAYIETKFYGQEFKGRPKLAFRTRIENVPRKEKDFLTKSDPYIDTWFLIMGKTREAFDLQSFVRAYPNIEGAMAELRRAVGRRVLHEDCPIVKMKERFAMQSDKATTTPPSKSKDNRETTMLNIKRKRLR